MQSCAALDITNLLSLFVCSRPQPLSLALSLSLSLSPLLTRSLSLSLTHAHLLTPQTRAEVRSWQCVNYILALTNSLGLVDSLINFRAASTSVAGLTRVSEVFQESLVGGFTEVFFLMLSTSLP